MLGFGPKRNAVFTRSNGKIEREAQRKFSKAQSEMMKFYKEHKVNPLSWLLANSYPNLSFFRNVLDAEISGRTLRSKFSLGY